jgi:hypothetical protein
MQRRRRRRQHHRPVHNNGNVLIQRTRSVLGYPPKRSRSSHQLAPASRLSSPQEAGAQAGIIRGVAGGGPQQLPPYCRRAGRWRWPQHSGSWLLSSPIETRSVARATASWLVSTCSRCRSPARSPATEQMHQTRGAQRADLAARWCATPSTSPTTCRLGGSGGAGSGAVAPESASAGRMPRPRGSPGATRLPDRELRPPSAGAAVSRRPAAPRPPAGQRPSRAAVGCAGR